MTKLDRLSRNLAFIAALMDSGVEFVAVDNPHANKLTIHILAAVAQHEREMIAQRTKDALQAANPNNAFADFCKPKTSKDDPPGYVPPWEVAAEAEAAPKAQELAVSTAELALIPPALIFVVGVGLTWAFRGFT